MLRDLAEGMTIRGLVIATLLLGPSIAAGDVPRQMTYGPGDAPDMGFVGEVREDELVLARQVLPAQTAPVRADTRDVALAQSRIVYLNKNGVTLSPGGNDARVNRSTVVNQQTAIVGWNASATVWNDTVTCMRELFAPFDVTIVDTDPGNVPHIEAVFGGTPQQVGMDANVAGVSPFTLDCSIIENSVVFTFTNAFNFTAREACEIMAQEVAHSYGLDHELLASDPMTYLPYNGNRSFKDEAAQCGESTARQCGINGSVCRPNQNSVQLLRERLGIADPIAPTIAITTPPDQATVPPGFQVKFSASDNNAVTGAVLKIDGAEYNTISGAGPFTFTTPTSLTEGSHTIVVEVTDGKNRKSETRTVTVELGAPPPPEEDEENHFGTVTGGCDAGGGGGGAVFALGLLAALASRRRERSAA